MISYLTVDDITRDPDHLGSLGRDRASRARRPHVTLIWTSPDGRERPLVWQHANPVISPRKLVISAATAASALVLLANPAFAHVEVEPTQVEPGSTSPVLFTIEHGCSESPTTKVEMQVPAGVTDVRPELVPGWEFAGGRERDHVDRRSPA